MPFPKPAKPAPWSSTSLADAYAEAVAEAALEQQADAGPQPLTQYQADPVGFLVQELGIRRETVEWSQSPEYAGHTWDGATDPIATALEAIARGQWVAVSSGVSTGKTFGMACAILWYIACFQDSIAVTVAITEKQQEKGVWREVGKLWARFQQRFPVAELTSLRIRMDPKRGDAWGAWAITAKVTADETSNASTQGLHNPRLLILCDEMPGIPGSIITALVNTATDEGNVIAGFGNPDNESDTLAKFGRRQRVQPIRISSLDHPNIVTGRTVVPGAQSRLGVQAMADEHGGESAMYNSRIRGIAPAQSADALIHRTWCDAAVVRGTAWKAQWAAMERPPKHPVAFGVDPANSDAGDDAAVARFWGPLCTSVVARPCPDAGQLGLTVYALAQAEGCPPQHVGVDSIGVGASTVNESRRLYQYTASFTPINNGAAPLAGVRHGGEGDGWEADVNRFLNVRAQTYWQARDDLQKGLIGLPDDPDLIEELIMPTFAVRAGKIVIEPKDEIRRRLGRSPNKADAFVIANWVRPRTIAPAMPAADAAERDHGLTIDAQTGKRRITRLTDKHPGTTTNRDTGKYWQDW